MIMRFTFALVLWNAKSFITLENRWGPSKRYYSPLTTGINLYIASCTNTHLMILGQINTQVGLIIVSSMSCLPSTSQNYYNYINCEMSNFLLPWTSGPDLPSQCLQRQTRRVVRYQIGKWKLLKKALCVFLSKFDLGLRNPSINIIFS